MAEVQYPDPAVPPVSPRSPRRLPRVSARGDLIGHARQAERSLTVVPDTDGPYVRLGLAWAVVTFAAVAAGTAVTAIWFSAVALVAAGQVTRAWRAHDAMPFPTVAVFGAAALPLGAAFGPVGLAGVAGAVAVAAVVSAGADRRVSVPLTLAVPLVIGLAAASPVLARQLGMAQALVLVAVVAAYDASAYVVGSGAAVRWEGPAAGVASIAAVTLAAAAIFVAPFRGVSPWLLGLLAAVLAPLGPYAGSALVNGRDDRVPALRRLDSLIVLGPLWVLAAWLLTG